jgi:hypothetical protein
MIGHELRPPSNGHLVPEAPRSFRIVFLGLSITSSWGNGHATTYRGLVRELCARGHDALFLERDAEWYAANRDLPKPPYGRVALYSSLRELKERFAERIRQADLVVVGSHVPEGALIGEWVNRIAGGVTAFFCRGTPLGTAPANWNPSWLRCSNLRHGSKRRHEDCYLWLYRHPGATGIPHYDETSVQSWRRWSLPLTPLIEAAGCGAPLLSEGWEGIGRVF